MMTRVMINVLYGLNVDDYDNFNGDDNCNKDDDDEKEAILMNMMAIMKKNTMAIW